MIIYLVFNLDFFFFFIKNLIYIYRLRICLLKYINIFIDFNSKILI